jgi:hypothetical protein
MRRLSFLVAAASAILSTPALCAGLPRKAALGIRLSPAPQGSSGALVAEAFPGGTGVAIGVRNGDLVVSTAGRPVGNPAEVIAYASSLRAGDKVELVVRRDGRDVHLTGKARPRPFETYADASVDYGAVPFRGGLLRDILVSPKGVTNPPVLFLLPGFTCASIEPALPDDPYRRLGAELAKRGVAYYRVEKPGLGDSIGTPACADVDFATELDAFRGAYKHLIETRHIDPDRIFMFGHSLGGLEAPLLAAELPPRGVAVYGTVLRNWADYHLDIPRYQTFLAEGSDPGEAAAATERARELLRQFYFGKKSPAELAAANPDNPDQMRLNFAWDGADKMFGRNYRFLQGLAGLPLASAWRRAKTNVLALYGESDIVAIDDRDHKLIADIADFYRPGSGRFVEIARTGHGMTMVGNRREYREKAIAAGGAAPDGPFNPEVAAVLAGWITDAMARQPVRLQPERQVKLN